MIENEDNTLTAYRIVGVYDSHGKIRDTWKFPNGFKAEAHLNKDNSVLIKYAP